MIWPISHDTVSHDPSALADILVIEWDVNINLSNQLTTSH